MPEICYFEVMNNAHNNSALITVRINATLRILAEIEALKAKHKVVSK